MSEAEAREGLATGKFTAYGDASTRLYATLDGAAIVPLKTTHDVDRYAGRLSDIHTGTGVTIRKA